MTTRITSHWFITLLMLMSWGILISISASNPLFIWIGMEINLLGFLPLLLNWDSTVSSSSIMKYFLVQVIASFAIMYSALVMHSFSTPNVTGGTVILLLALMSKMGLPPYHFWLPPLMSSISWVNCLILATLQKLIPLMLISALIISPKIVILLMSFSLLVSTLGGLNQTCWRALMAYSSMNHMVWCMVALMCSFELFMLYFFVYSITLMALFFTMEWCGMDSLSNVAKRYTHPEIPCMLTIILFSLAGLPPLLGFFPKLMIIMSANSMMPWALGLLLISSGLNLWFYINMSLGIQGNSSFMEKMSVRMPFSISVNYNLITSGTIMLF